MKNTELFSNKAGVYAASRPGYARDAVLYLMSLTGGGGSGNCGRGVGNRDIFPKPVGGRCASFCR